MAVLSHRPNPEQNFGLRNCAARCHRRVTFISDYPVPEWVPAEERAMLSDAARRILRPPARDSGSHQREAMLREARL